jgi:hypothetical protein
VGIEKLSFWMRDNVVIIRLEVYLEAGNQTQVEASTEKGPLFSQKSGVSSWDILSWTLSTVGFAFLWLWGKHRWGGREKLEIERPLIIQRAECDGAGFVF